MAVRSETSTRNSLAEHIRDLIDGGSAAGEIIYETSGDVEVAKCTCTDPCAGSATNGAITFSSITSDTSAAGGVIAHVTFQDSASNKIFECDIAITTSQEFQISTKTITAGDTVGVSSCTLTVPAT